MSSNNNLSPEKSSFNQLKEKLEALIYRASEKLLNLVTYQIGKENMLSYKDKLEHVNMKFHISSSSEPLVSNHWYQELSEHIRNKNIVIPILAHGILRPDHSQFSKNHYFGGILHVIQQNKDNDNLDDYFSRAKTCNSVCNTITSHWPLTEEIHQELKLWLKSEDVAVMSTNIDLVRNDHAATGDLCEVLVLLHISNQYLNCYPLENDLNIGVLGAKPIIFRFHYYYQIIMLVIHLIIEKLFCVAEGALP